MGQRQLSGVPIRKIQDSAQVKGVLGSSQTKETDREQQQQMMKEDWQVIEYVTKTTTTTVCQQNGKVDPSFMLRLLWKKVVDDANNIHSLLDQCLRSQQDPIVQCESARDTTVNLLNSLNSVIFQYQQMVHAAAGTTPPPSTQTHGTTFLSSEAGCQPRPKKNQKHHHIKSELVATVKEEYNAPAEVVELPRTSTEIKMEVQVDYASDYLPPLKMQRSASTTATSRKKTLSPETLTPPPLRKNSLGVQNPSRLLMEHKTIERSPSMTSVRSSSSNGSVYSSHSFPTSPNSVTSPSNRATWMATKTVSKSGWLKKKGFWSKWQSAWFVLQGPVLMEFKNEKGGKPHKVISLQHCHLRQGEHQTGTKYSFGIFDLDDKDPIFLCASNEAEMAEWIAVLLTVCRTNEVSWESEDQRMLDAFNNAVVITSEEGTITGVNNRALEMFGYTRNEMMGHPVTIIMPTRFHAVHGNYMSSYMKTKDKRLIGKPRILPMVRADGAPMQVLLSLGEIEQNGTTKFIATLRLADSDGTMTRGTVERLIESAVESITNQAALDLKAKIMEEVAEKMLDNINSLKESMTHAQPRSPGANNRADVSKPEYREIFIAERISHAGGSGGSIHTAYVDGWQCVVKEFSMTFLTPEAVESIDNEICLLESLPIHMNLVRYLFHRKVTGEHGDMMQIFMTKYSNSLGKIIANRKMEERYFTVLEVAKMWLDLAKGLEALHLRHIIHRDLKSDNVFIMLNAQGNIGNLVIADFDTAKSVTDGKNAVTTIGTPGFIAPEVMNSRGFTPYSFKSDVWSLAIVAYEMMTLKRPFEDRPLSMQVAAYDRGTLPIIDEPLMKKYEALLPLWEDCLNVDPEKRPSSAQLKAALAQLTENEESPVEVSMIEQQRLLFVNNPSRTFHISKQERVRSGGTSKR
ncbi:hypothetical protein PROFUN_04195 [Planoprotostelium fungivorum]|uniref:non-specific serine/threonine protein kinase n=1 Tax=Planoprotostelium fungivorum TaxID=1890364 RepID=A0A2P6NVW4_9EUKA|nr:hypothetical protein PROFUN_04195 [Planoprotostelium fungivorum]